MDTAEQAAALLNEMLAADAIATEKLVNSRVRCNRELADHPTIQVGRQDGYTVIYDVGLLGVLNGLCARNRRVVAVIDNVTMHIVRFDACDWRLETRADA